MLNKTMQAIDEKLLAEDEFSFLEENLVFEDHQAKYFSELIDLISEVAFLEGYKQGIRETAAEEIKAKLLENLNVNDLNNILASLEIAQKRKEPAADTTDSLSEKLTN